MLNNNHHHNNTKPVIQEDCIQKRTVAQKEIKIFFPEKRKLKEFLKTRPALQETLKRILQVEMKG